MNDVLCSIQFDVSISMNYEYTVGKLYSSHCFIIQRCIYVFPEVAIDMVAYTLRVYFQTQWFNDRRCHCMSECVYCSITSYDCQLISMFRHWSTTKIMSMTQSLDTLYVNINKYQSGRMIMVILTRSNRYIFKSKLMSGRWTVVVLLCTCTTENYG